MYGSLFPGLRKAMEDVRSTWTTYRKERILGGNVAKSGQSNKFTPFIRPCRDYRAASTH